MNSSVIYAGGGVVYRLKEGEPQVLLIHRRGVWDLPKGMLDEGETLVHCAAREVAEETGMALPMVLTFLCDTRHQFQKDGTTVEKHTFWYAMVSRGEELQPQTEEEITDLSWFPFEQAMNNVGFDNLREVLHSFEKWWSALR